MKSGSRIQYFLLSDAEPKAISFSSSLLKRYNASKGSFFLQSIGVTILIAVAYKKVST